MNCSQSFGRVKTDNISDYDTTRTSGLRTRYAATEKCHARYGAGSNAQAATTVYTDSAFEPG